VVHAAVSGISAFVAPDGRVLAETQLFEPTIIRHGIRTSDRMTLYVRLGNWVPLVSVFMFLGVAVLPRRGRRSKRAAEPLPEQPRALVILPTYEERDTIEWVIERLLELPDRVEILVIDDSSPDGTGRLVSGIAGTEPRVRLLERPAKSGLASAYELGFAKALENGYDLIVEMDSDLSHDPGQLMPLLAAAWSHDMVIGSRYVPGGSVTNWSRTRVLLSRGGNAYARLCLGFPFRDATSGFRVYRSGVLRALTSEPIVADGYGFQVELALRAWRLGFDVVESPITFREREHGHSKLSRRIVFEALWKVTVWGLKARLRP
jgi:glycosyltransferase involved in cell wall biosynthesis